MEFKRNARIQAPLSDVWALVDDVPTVAGCIPGVHDLDMRGEREFDCVVSQRVGSVKSNFALHIVADFQVTGRIATFGHRIISAKAEQVVMEAIRNVDKLLGERRATSTEG